MVSTNEPTLRYATLRRLQIRFWPHTSTELIIYLTGEKCEMRGKRLAVFELIKKNMSVRDLQLAAIKKFKNDAHWMGRTLQVLKAAETAGLLKVK